MNPCVLGMFLGDFIPSLKVHRGPGEAWSFRSHSFKCHLWNWTWDLLYYCEEDFISEDFRDSLGIADIFELSGLLNCYFELFQRE